MHFHKGGSTIDLMRMYKQIWKLHLRKITSKIYAKSWNSRQKFLGIKFINTSF